MDAVREWGILAMARHHGVTPKRNMGVGALTLRCPSCPQPDMNMDPKWDKRPKSEWSVCFTIISMPLKLKYEKGIWMRYIGP